MSYLEGIGDEVTILFTLLFILILIYIAWLSTSVSDRPLIRVVVLDRARFQEFLHRFTQRIRNITPTNTPPETPTTPESTIVTENVSTNVVENKSTTLLSGQSLSQISTETIATSDLVNTNTPTDAQLHAETETQTVPVCTQRDIRDETIAQSVLDSFLLSTQTSNIDQSENRSTDAATSQTHTEASTSDINKATTSAQSEHCQDGSSVDSDSVLPSGESAAQQEAQSRAESSPSADQEEELLDGFIRIRLKYLDERQKLVQARPSDTIGQFKRANFSVELADNFAVRFIFGGQELREDRSTLEAYNIEDNSVIHCLLTRITQPQQSTNHQPPAGLDLGFLMFPLVAVILGLVWYCRVVYRNYFSAVSTLSLVGMTFLFIVALMASRGREQRHEHRD